MAKKMSELHRIAKAYVDVVFAERLREEGFVNKDDNGLNWYRVVGEDILQAIHFFTPYPNVWNIDLMINYGIHPLFIRPDYPDSVRYRNRSWDSQISRTRVLYEPDLENPGNYITGAIFSHEIPVICPIRSTRGLYTFDSDLLPLMNKRRTVADCYWNDVYERETYNPGETGFRGMSESFMDEAIYLQDTEHYKYCRVWLQEILDELDRAQQKRPLTEEQLKRKLLAEQRLAAIDDGKREEYLLALEERKRANILELESKTGIIIR